MINLLIPLKKRKISLKEIFEIIKKSNYKNEIFVRILCEKNNLILQEKPLEKMIYTFDVFPLKTSEDSMIFSSTKKLDVDELIILRDGSKNFSTTNLDTLIKNGKEGNDLVIFSQNNKKNKIKTFFSNLFSKICKNFFNFNFYGGDVGFVYYSSQAHNILQETNVTAMTKTNRWTCLKIKYIEENNIKTLSKYMPDKKIIFNLIGYILLLTCAIIGTIFLGNAGKLTMLYIALFACLVTVFICMIAYSILKWFCYRKIGEMYCKKVDMLERRYDG